MIRQIMLLWGGCSTPGTSCARALATLLPLCLILTFAPARWLYRCLSIKNCTLLLTYTPQEVPVYMLVLTSTPHGVAAAVTSCRSIDDFDS